MPPPQHIGLLPSTSAIPDGKPLRTFPGIAGAFRFPAIPDGKPLRTFPEIALTEEQGRDHDRGYQPDGSNENGQADHGMTVQSASHGELLHPLRVKQNAHAPDLFIL